MSEKIQKPSVSPKKKVKRTFRQWVLWALFTAIVVTLTLSMVNLSRFTENVDGVAATVNDATISLATYHTTLENFEQNTKARLAQFPEEQRRELTARMQRQVLEDLIRAEIEYQAARSRGVQAADGEVRDFILEQIPFLRVNGRFQKDQYQAFLQQRHMSSDDFEREIRKMLVGQKLQELFLGSATPTREELKRDSRLASQKVNLRFVELSKDDLQKSALISEGDVNEFLKANKTEVETYYKNNIIEFTKPEKVHASHILIRVDEKRPDAEALKLASELRKSATAKNFAQLASKNSDDPGSKAKGGDLGEFERGRMVPEFETAAFALAPGQISQPIKTPFGYHVIFVDKKTPGGTESLQSAQVQIARKLLIRGKEAEVVGKARNLVEKSGKKEVDAFVQKAGLKWIETGEFDLSAPAIPKLQDGKSVVDALVKHGKTLGLIPQLISTPEGHFVIVDVAQWKDAPESTPPSEGMERMVAYRKGNDLIDAWSKDIKDEATVVRNPRIMER